MLLTRDSGDTWYTGPWLGLFGFDLMLANDNDNRLEDVLACLQEMPRQTGHTLIYLSAAWRTLCDYRVSFAKVKHATALAFPKCNVSGLIASKKTSQKILNL